MKNLILLLPALFLFSCNSGNSDCDCTQQRWQRSAEYQGTTTNLVATTDWNAVELPQPISSTDCSLNGTIGDEGVMETEILPNGNTKKLEYQYRIYCQ